MFGTSSYKKKLIIINVANIITTNTESQNRKWEKKKKKEFGKNTSSVPSPPRWTSWSWSSRRGRI